MELMGVDGCLEPSRELMELMGVWNPRCLEPSGVDGCLEPSGTLGVWNPRELMGVWNPLGS